MLSKTIIAKKSTKKNKKIHGKIVFGKLSGKDPWMNSTNRK